MTSAVFTTENTLKAAVIPWPRTLRQKTEERLPLCHIFPDHQMARELEKISEILDQNPRISALVLQDLV